MHWSSSNLLEVFGLLLIAVATGALFGAWWGVGVAGVEFVVYGVALHDDGTPPSGAA